MHESNKPIVWLRSEISTPPFSKEARIEAGYLLRCLQTGMLLSLPQSRPMPSIGKRCHELRITDSEKIWRIFYRIDNDAIIVASILQKKTQKTPELTIKTCVRRLKEYDTI